MPKRTIYARDEDQALWDRAEELAGGNLSGFLAVALKEHVASREADLNIEEHGPITNRVLYVWGSHSTDGRYASGTSFDADATGTAAADQRVRVLKADSTIAHVQLEERRVFSDKWVGRLTVDEWVRDDVGAWRPVTPIVSRLGDPYLVRTLDAAGIVVRNIGNGPAIDGIYVSWYADASNITDLFHLKPGDEIALKFVRPRGLYAPKSIYTDRLVDGRGEALVCSNAAGLVWRFLPAFATSASRVVTKDASTQEWLDWYETTITYPPSTRR